jgi:hypothetical protein
MPTKKSHRQALLQFGIKPEDYFIDGWPPIWGTAYKHQGKDVFVIESHGAHHDDATLRNKFLLKDGRGVLRKPLSIHRTKREALATGARKFLA